MPDKTEVTKICQDCLVQLPLSDFYGNGIGYKTRCKSCYSIRYKEKSRLSKKQRDPEAVKAYNRNYWNSLYTKETYRLKLNARSLVHHEVKAGRLIKPIECPECKSTAKIEAHHNDYNKPLDVLWLCRKCHISKHKGD